MRLSLIAQHNNGTVPYGRKKITIYSQHPKTGRSGFRMVIFWTIFWVRFSNGNKMADHSKTGRIRPVFEW
jgi:hypothetical protein